MYKYQLLIEYDGTTFVGWQAQRNGPSIQDIIQKSLEKFLKVKITLYGSGRTDAGVHALMQSAHFILSKKIINKERFINSLNFFLSKYSISIIDIKKKI